MRFQYSLETASLTALLLIVGFAYWPGLGGGFLFDDGENLRTLANLPANPGVDILISHALHHFSGATRILPAFTFALQHSSWPERPGSMIAVNIAIHLFNGALIFLISRKLAAMLAWEKPIAIATVAAAIWMIHPIQVSGTLYVIQRINQMSALFALAGIAAYLHGRKDLVRRPAVALVWMTGALAIGGGAALACKENGALLPLFLLVLEGTLMSHLPWPSNCNWWRRTFLFLPNLILIFLLFWFFESHVQPGYDKRDFSLGERLLTECGVLLDYLKLILLPRGFGLGLFHDDYPVTRLPLTVGATIQIVSVVGLLFSALWLRKRLPVAAFGLLWFFAGHAMESSVVPLELYFEHRNYLPLFGPALAAAALVVPYAVTAKKVLRAGLLVMGGGWLSIAMWITWQQTNLWGQPQVLPAVWAYEHPMSIRAQMLEARILNYQGFKDAAAKTISRVVEGIDGRAEYYPEWMSLACDGRMGSMPPVSNVAGAFEKVRLAVEVMNGMSRLADMLEEGGCKAYSAQDLAKLVDVLLDNPHYDSREKQLLILRGRFRGASGQWDGALDDFRQAYSKSYDPEVAFLEVRALAALERPDAVARRLEDISRIIDANGIRFQQYRPVLEAWTGKGTHDTIN